MTNNNMVSTTEFLRMINDLKTEEEFLLLLNMLENKRVYFDKSKIMRQSLQTTELNKNIQVVHREIIPYLIKDGDDDIIHYYVFYNLIYNRVKSKLEGDLVQVVYSRICDTTSPYFMEQCRKSTL